MSLWWTTRDLESILSEDALGNKVVIGQITFDFTDGDGNLGLPPLEENSNPLLPDSLKYNFFLQLYDLQGYEYVKIPESQGGHSEIPDSLPE